MTGITVVRGDQPMIAAFPHGGTALAGCDHQFVSPWLARLDTDWWIAELYAFVQELGITTVATTTSRAVIDCNRDPSGASLYPGQATTALCPLTTFDGASLYPGTGPDAVEIARRQVADFAPYHAALRGEVTRLRSLHPRIVLYDAHSIRSRVPRLFDGTLPTFNIGTNDTTSCAPTLEQAVAAVCAGSGQTWTTNGRFKGGWTTRHYGRPDQGIHALQLELAMAAYLDEPNDLAPDSWPPAFNPDRARAVQRELGQIVQACLTFAKEPT